MKTHAGDLAMGYVRKREIIINLQFCDLSNLVNGVVFLDGEDLGLGG